MTTLANEIYKHLLGCDNGQETYNYFLVKYRNCLEKLQSALDELVRDKLIVIDYINNDMTLCVVNKALLKKLHK